MYNMVGRLALDFQLEREGGRAERQTERDRERETETETQREREWKQIHKYQK